MTNKPTIRALNGICTVKNTSLFFDYDKNQYHLVHYDTEILVIKQYHADIRSREIVKCLKCSNSSTRAIYQVTDFLQLDRQYVKKSMVKFDKFAKYKTGEVNKKKNELLKVIEQ